MDKQAVGTGTGVEWLDEGDNLHHKSGILSAAGSRKGKPGELAPLKHVTFMCSSLL